MERPQFPPKKKLVISRNDYTAVPHWVGTRKSIIVDNSFFYCLEVLVKREPVEQFQYSSSTRDVNELQMISDRHFFFYDEPL